MEIHLRALVVGRKQNCWFNTWELSQIVQNFEVILASIYTKSSKTDVLSSVKVRIAIKLYVLYIFLCMLCIDLLNYV